MEKNQSEVLKELKRMSFEISERKKEINFRKDIFLAQCEASLGELLKTESGLDRRIARLQKEEAARLAKEGEQRADQDPENLSE